MSKEKYKNFNKFALLLSLIFLFTNFFLRADFKTFSSIFELLGLITMTTGMLIFFIGGRESKKK